MPTETLLRRTEEADIAALAAIYADAVLTGTASYELEPPGEAEMARRWRELVGKGFPHIVAVRDGALVGYAYAGPYRPRPAYRFSVEDSIYIDPSAQRRGIGRVLLEHLIAECERRGFRQMVAVIGDSAQTASIELHRALGFRLVGTVENVGCKFDQWLDSV